jgi:phosphopantothenoylcysteine synthetase/decarboxylase
MTDRKCIVLTAGGTREPIDDVRFVSNIASGALPAAMANVLLGLGHDVHYIHGPGAIRPGHALLDMDLTTTNAEALEAQTHAWLADALTQRSQLARGTLTLLPIQSAQDVATTLRAVCAALQPDAVACAMAVADFAPVAATGKLSSRHATLTLEMAATEKAIDGVKAVAPRTRLLGFKLLSRATEAQFREAAGRQIQRAYSDLVFCNDMQDLNEGRRRGLVIGAGGEIRARLDGGSGPTALGTLAAALVAAWLSE